MCWHCGSLLRPAHIPAGCGAPTVSGPRSGPRSARVSTAPPSCSGSRLHRAPRMIVMTQRQVLAACSPARSRCSTLPRSKDTSPSRGHNCPERFKRDSLAIEEICAELTASFVLADLGIAHHPRPDHAAYVASWLRALKDDPRAIFTAASKAQAAADWMHAQQPQSEQTAP